MSKLLASAGPEIGTALAVRFDREGSVESAGSPNFSVISCFLPPMLIWSTEGTTRTAIATAAPTGLASVGRGFDLSPFRSVKPFPIKVVPSEEFLKQGRLTVR